MIELNPKYEAIFDARNIDEDCDKIAELMRPESNLIREALDAGLYRQAVTMYLQLLNSMCKHFWRMSITAISTICIVQSIRCKEYTMIFGDAT